jgi:hypothetical protein
MLVMIKPARVCRHGKYSLSIQKYNVSVIYVLWYSINICTFLGNKCFGIKHYEKASTCVPYHASFYGLSIFDED